MTPTILVIISGGQVGADRGALDAALEAGVICGGFCPEGRRAEDGMIPLRYPLVELEAPDYPTRTERNVVAASATLILCHGEPAGGTRLTRTLVARHRRPGIVLDLDVLGDHAGRAAEWLSKKAHADHSLLSVVLNVAGPRESKQPGIQEETRAIVARLLAELGRTW